MAILIRVRGGSLSALPEIILSARYSIELHSLPRKAIDEGYRSCGSIEVTFFDNTLVWFVYVFVAVLEICAVKRYELRDLSDAGGFFAAKIVYRLNNLKFMAVHVILPAD